ncbi:MAG TPA: class I SAM-dependent methyltransferase [Actinomycetota bacterium]
MAGWTRENLRHLGTMFKQGANPAAAVYESLGTDLFLAAGPGWLNVGYWRSDGDPAEAADAPRELVRHLADVLPRRGTIIDVGNGLGAQDPVIADVALPSRLIAINITEMQLRAGADRLALARARPVCADATRLPLASGCADGLISVEAAFHFPSRALFYAEARRVLRRGGIVSIGDVAVQRWPRGIKELAAGAANVRFWGLKRASAQSADEMLRLLKRAGFEDIEVQRCGERTIDPMVAFCSEQLARGVNAPRLQSWGAARMLDTWRILRRSGVIDYVLIRATAA